jgi:N-acetylmuramoyl-L-alanine amidase
MSIIIKGEPVIGIRAGHGGLHPETGQYTTPAKTGKFWIHSKDLPIDLHRTTNKGKVFYEGVFNRYVADLVSEKLDSVNVPNIQFHHPYLDIPLKKQCATINAQHKITPIPLLLELHSNASNGKGRGFEVFTTPGNGRSDFYAEWLYIKVKERIEQIILRPDKSDGDHDKEAKYTMLMETHCSAILPEFGFFDNPEDILLIMNPEIIDTYTTILAEVAQKAYLDYLSIKKPK